MLGPRGDLHPDVGASDRLREPAMTGSGSTGTGTQSQTGSSSHESQPGLKSGSHPGGYRHGAGRGGQGHGPLPPRFGGSKSRGLKWRRGLAAPLEDSMQNATQVTY